MDNAQIGNIYEGQMNGQGMRVALVVGRFNSLVVERLVQGATDTLRRYAVDASDVQLAYVPGAFEIPLVAKRFAESGHFDAVICLGAIIRGATPHFDYVAGPCAQGVMQAGLAAAVPVVFGVLTCDTLEQAFDRAGGKAGNKGSDAALTAIEMVQLVQVLPKKASRQNA